jgi:hypothetical protein
MPIKVQGGDEAFDRRLRNHPGAATHRVPYEPVKGAGNDP